MTAVSVVACLLLGTQLPTAMAADAEAKSIGIILEVRGSVQLRKSGESSKARALDRKGDVYRHLEPGSEVKCEKDSRVQILLLFGKELTITNSDWTEIKMDGVDPKTQAVYEAHQDYARVRQGRERGEAAIYWPANGGRVTLERFEAVRWTPGRFQAPAKLILRDAKSRIILWRHREIDGVSGRFMNDSLRTELQAHLKRTGREFELELSDSKIKSEVSFSLLNEAEAQQLQQELEFWDSHFQGVVRHIGRAACFQKRKLFNDAADEYDSAIESEDARESIDLLRRTITAHEITRNYSRVIELERRLPRQ